MSTVVAWLLLFGLPLLLVTALVRDAHRHGTSFFLGATSVVGVVVVTTFVGAATVPVMHLLRYGVAAVFVLSVAHELRRRTTAANPG